MQTILIRVFPLILFAVPMLCYANFWSSRGAGIAVPKPIPGFNPKDYPTLSGMLVAETRDLSQLHPGRGLILWLKNASKYEATAEDYESCPGQVVGSNYSGQIYVSLVDTSRRQFIQTIFFDMENQESSSVPFRIIGGLYSVHGNENKIGERETVLLDPVRIDNDPKSEEYALFVNPGGCFCPGVVAYGYSSIFDQLFRMQEQEYSLEGEKINWKESVFLFDTFFIANQKPGQDQYDFVTKEGHGAESFTLHRIKYDMSLRTFYGISFDLPDDEKNNREYLDKTGWVLTPKAHRLLANLWEQIKPEIKTD